MLSSSTVWSAALGALALLPGAAMAGFSSSATNNVAIYWGQNSANQAGTQQRLSTYCSNSNLNVIPLAFLHVIKNPTLVNFANAGDNCTVFAGTQLLKCPQIEEDIKTCQTKGKTILLSIGGATYTEGGFSSSSEAATWANTIWAMFGPVQSGNTINRPFGSAVIDGFDLDFEAISANMVPFANQLRANMDAASSVKKFFLSVAPQCPYPDAANGEMLNGAVSFDFVAIQFYNNYCGVSSYVPGASTQNNFNFATWDNWAKTVSRNPAVKILLGIPGSTSAGGGYVSGSQLNSVIAYSKQFSSFGGVMIWDMSQVFNNVGFLDSVGSALGGTNPPPPPVTTTITTRPTTTTMVTITTTTRPPTTTTAPGTVPQWGQCGGRDYTGPTQCQAPWHCVYVSDWWSQCN
ncbi:glycoside hydrolase family 18 protein [Apodospora peruviana]|uniref:chitinase n=1 Tax=Apodospora peruviana TaxID=516989 RepID=A0AAE0I5P4_9PEZI|nr:glycoside hydrolase family 18 protein [Apodospora peruviana]